jgi:N-acylethanolamine-hydrolysing acid amidase
LLTIEQAVDILSTRHLISVEYIIIGGAKSGTCLVLMGCFCEGFFPPAQGIIDHPGDGAVVTRDRQKAVDVWRLDPPSRWFLVETNYDHWFRPRATQKHSQPRRLPVPPSDNRRGPANARMNASSAAALTPDYLYAHVMDKFPHLNSATTYTVSHALLSSDVPLRRSRR